jgi:hydrogenase maturation protease
VRAGAVFLAHRSPLSSESRAVSADTTLVIGYGNSLRTDDGVGPAVARAVARWRRPGVRTLAVHQLTPELASDLARVDRAIFVDARVADPHGDVEVVSLPGDDVGSPGADAHAGTVHSRRTVADGHHGDPRALLALAELAYGRRPRALLVTVPAVKLDFGEGLSSTTRARMSDALDAIRALLGIQSRRHA